MPEDESKFFTMRIPVSLRRDVKAHCAQEEISMKEFCEKALIHYLTIRTGVKASSVSKPVLQGNQS